MTTVGDSLEWQVSGVLKTTKWGDGSVHMLWCPGCNRAHIIYSGAGLRTAWEWNGDQDRPTFTPSYLATWDENRCHSFIKDGCWQYLADCTHPFAGQTVPIPPWKEGM